MPWKFIKDLEPQKARGKLVESLWGDPNWIVEEKYDGERRIAQFCGKVVRFTGCSSRVTGAPVEKTEQLPHLSNIAMSREFIERAYASASRISFGPTHRADLNTPALDGTVLDGELILPEGYEVPAGGKSKAVTSIANSSPEEAVRKQVERGWLRYIVFDCLWFKGRDLRQETLGARRMWAEMAVKEWGNPFVGLSRAALGGHSRAFCENVLALGGEGVVLKRLDHKYGDKNGWVKVKAEWTADCVIMGFKDAKEMSKKVDGSVSMTKYAKEGLIGAVVLGQWKQPSAAGAFMFEVATISGMDDGLRRAMTDNPRRFMKQVVEIKHNGREPTGRFRHPRFKRIRTDKAPRDCVYREDET